jgi:hypothetical protein
MKSKSRGFWPALLLFFLSPMLAELLSGSSPPVEFFQPFALFMLAALYGSGAILIRELRVRWDKGWPTVFALGAAYGIIEEGLMVKSFFDPNWMDLGMLGSYGRWAGVNWVWSLELTIFHAVFSIAIPILLVELIFPNRRDESWIGRRGMLGLSLLLAADVLIGFFLLTAYRPPIIPYLLAVIAAAALCLIARRLPECWSRPVEGWISRPLYFGAIGFGATLLFFLIQWIPPEIGLPVLLTMTSTVVLVVFLVWAVRRMSKDGAWSDKHRLALASGGLMFFVLLAPLQELDAERMDNTTGMTIVGLVVMLFLFWMHGRVTQRDQRKPQPNLPPRGKEAYIHPPHPANGGE